VTGFSTWTSSQLTDATSTQLGSLALLASTASGIAALLSSAQNLKVMVSASRRYLEITELILSRKSNSGADKATMGFTKENGKYIPVTLLDFWRAMGSWDIFGVLLFAPAFILLPFGNEQERSPLGTPFQLPVDLGESRVFFTRTENEQVTVTLERTKTSEMPGETVSGESITEENQEVRGNKGKSKEAQNLENRIENSEIRKDDSRLNCLPDDNTAQSPVPEAQL
jgi:hypothetical protein